MVCEFLPPKFKKQLLEIATIDDLIQAGYKMKGAYTAKEREIISDEKCEKLVKVLGERARPILQEALKDFKTQLIQLGVNLDNNTDIPNTELKEINEKPDKVLRILNKEKKTSHDLVDLFD